MAVASAAAGHGQVQFARSLVVAVFDLLLPRFVPMARWPPHSQVLDDSVNDNSDPRLAFF